MPRSRRRHHSRSRSRSASPDRDRDVKRRKVESCEDGVHANRRSVSSEPEANAQTATATSPSSTTAPTSIIVNAPKSPSPPPPPPPPTPVTPSTPQQKAPTPKQAAKRLESEQRKLERQREKEERERKRLEERDERRRQRDAKEAKEREERERKRAEERDERRRQRDAKEAKTREERDARERDKLERRKEKDAKRDEERSKRQAELDEREREKQRAADKQLKAAAAFTRFFVQPKVSKTAEEEAAPAKRDAFMPFEVKSDMRLAPTTRNCLTPTGKRMLDDCLTDGATEQPVVDVWLGRPGRRTRSTWPSADLDVTVVDDLGESILKPEAAATRMKAKFLKFHENRRPPFYGTWRKRCAHVTGRRPLGRAAVLHYDVDSDEEWEEEEEGEDIAGSEGDDDDKEPAEGDANDYEVDDEFFVPHGHLSDDEGGSNEDDDEERVAPEMRKAKEKLLRRQFDEERSAQQTQRLKPRVIGCVWYDAAAAGVDAAIDVFLRPLAIISAGVVRVKGRAEIAAKYTWRLDKALWPDLLRLLHGNRAKKKVIVDEFYAQMATRGREQAVSKVGMFKLIAQVAKWRKYPTGRGHVWLVNEETRREFSHLNFDIPTSGAE